MRNSLKIVFLFLVCLTFSSCLIPIDRTTFRYQHITEKPDDSELIGTWIADLTTLEDMKIRGNYDSSKLPKLVFSENGSFEMIDIPNWWRSNFGESNGGFESFKGKWELSNSYSKIWWLNLNLGDLRTDLGLKKNNFSNQPKYIIYSFIGDPDSGNLMVFIKQ